MPPFYSSLDIPEEAPRERGFSADQYPIFDEISRAVGFPGTPVTPTAETLLTGKPYPIKGLIVEGHNPVATWANANKTREALKTLDLLVVIDLFMTETAQLAHVILPAASFLEITGLAQYGALPPLDNPS